MKLTKQRLDLMMEDIVDELGFGHRENIYQNALRIELEETKFYDVEKEVTKEIFYKGQNLGNVRIDLLVDECCIIEMKTLRKVTDKERNQVERYLRVFNLPKGFLINISLYDFEIFEIDNNSYKFDPVSD